MTTKSEQQQQQTNGTARKWDTIRLGIQLGSVILLVVAVVGIMCLSGQGISVEQILLVAAAGAALAGLAVPKLGGGGGAAAAGGILLLLTVLMGSGCACFQAVQALRDVETEADVYAALPIVAECAEQAGELIGQCRSGAGLEELLEEATAPASSSPQDPH